MKRMMMLCVVTSVVCIAGSGFAEEGAKPKKPAPPFEKFDTNGDGEISKEEFITGNEKQQAAKTAAFDKKDANKDGVLSPAEYNAKGKGKPKPKPQDDEDSED